MTADNKEKKLLPPLLVHIILNRFLLRDISKGRTMIEFGCESDN